MINSGNTSGSASVGLTGTAATTLCCICGVSMTANKVNTCAQCLQTTHDVTADFSKQGVILRCKGCDRYQKAASDGWVHCELESKPLLALCLKKIKGLQNVSLIDAKFVWTEEHSKRIKVKIKVQKEITTGVVLQQECTVEFVVQNRFCEDCHARAASISWDSVVQVRQKVSHKRTFLYLEQLIIKYGADQHTIKVEPHPEGVDFFFAAVNDARRFIDFLETVVPMRYKTAKQIVSLDTKSNLAKYKTTFSVEIVSICKDDVVCLPRPLAQKVGSIQQLALCLNVSNVVRFIDPKSCQVCEVDAEKCVRWPFRAIKTISEALTFVVLDVQLEDNSIKQAGQNVHKHAPALDDVKKKKRRRKGEKGSGGRIATEAGNISKAHALCWVEVCRESDLGVNDQRFTVLSHLGYILRPGDTCLGYDLSTANLNDDDAERIRDDLPEVVLIRKTYPKLQKSRTNRAWKLKSLVLNGTDEAGFGIVGKPRDKEGYSHERDREMFMRDLEEDEEMRSKVNIYRVGKFDQEASGSTSKSDPTQHEDLDGEEVEPDTPMVGVEEMLEDMTLST